MNDQTIEKKTLYFSATDTLFFKESRPMDAEGELQSIFPPSMRTLTGAIRHWIGTQYGVDWEAFKQEKDHCLREIIGSPQQENDLGQLQFQGCWLHKKKQRLYPAPLHLMKKDKILFELQLSEQGHWCDLGKKIRLAKLPNEEAKGSKPLSNTWIDGDTLAMILNGKTPTFSLDHFFTEQDLISKESRIGIARDNKTRTVIESMLYQTQHIRLRDKVQLAVEVTGLPEKMTSIKDPSLIRLGGEARMASLVVKPEKTPLPCFNKLELAPTGTSKRTVKQQSKQILKKANGLMIYLLTPLLIEQNTDQWQPLPCFTWVEKKGETSYWEGKLMGKEQQIRLRLHGAITGKTIREGGWDAANHRPRALQSFIPAGSVFYCESTAVTLEKAIDALHGLQMGELQQYGYGQIAVGIWK